MEFPDMLPLRETGPFRRCTGAPEEAPRGPASLQRPGKLPDLYFFGKTTPFLRSHCQGGRSVLQAGRERQTTCPRRRQPDSQGLGGSRGCPPRISAPASPGAGRALPRPAARARGRTSAVPALRPRPRPARRAGKARYRARPPDPEPARRRPRLGLRARGDPAPASLVPQEAKSSYLPGDRKLPVPPPPSPPPLAHGEPVPPPPPPPHLRAPPALSASPGGSAGLRHGLHRARRGGTHRRASAQARSERTRGARTAGRVAAYYGGRFRLTSAPLPPAPVPGGPAALLRRREAAPAKRACVGCVYSVQIRPMETGIRSLVPEEASCHVVSRPMERSMWCCKEPSPISGLPPEDLQPANNHIFLQYVIMLSLDEI
ncbi:formin-like protein 5 [Equus quagga]|uniref:formin-like protein 5 n=1 Tax=Equus quagga TaxID=89248 RepID=UPI001EE21013|nr:formin-like protein 5 [Equus quagga]